MTRAHCLDLFAYNLWATTRLLDALEALPADTPCRPEALRLLSHVQRAEIIWLSRARGIDAGGVAVWVTDPLDLCRPRAEVNHCVWTRLLEATEDDAFGQTVAYQTTEGEPYANTLGEIVTHVVNHGTHHRGQVARLLRENGHPPPPMDYIFFKR